MSKKRRGKPARSRVPARTPGTRVSTFEITDEPILDQEYKRLPDEVKEAIRRLYPVVHKSPRQAIPELLDWTARYPNVPMFYNYLSAAYTASGQRAKAEATVMDNYRRNPDYLFARVNYAELCLARRDLDAVPAIFDHKFDLKQLYPRRNRFHISEVVGFMSVVGQYFFETGKTEAAANYYEIINQVAPQHPLTRRLRRKLRPGLLRRLFRLARR